MVPRYQVEDKVIDYKEMHRSTFSVKQLLCSKVLCIQHVLSDVHLSKP